jgi:D-glycero-alpha-D-manno-heptose 1-phosphate guanylyltransferase
MSNQKTLLVLAGGFGTRLKSVVSEVPKPLAPVNGYPFLYYQIKNWTSQGIKDFVFLLYHQADLLIEFLKSEEEGILKNCNTRWIIETEPMGTGGAVANCIKELNLSGDFLITNADTWLGSGLKELSQTLSPAMTVVNVEDCGRYGSVKINENHVIAFEEKTNTKGRGWINAGMCSLNAGVFSDSEKKVFSLEQITFPALANSGQLKAVKLTTEFIDIGVPEDYFRFINLIHSQTS